jgi:hypothetical protein
MWKLNAQYSEVEKSELVNNMYSELSGLEGKIDELKSITIYRNAEKASDTNYDIMLDTTFNSINDLNFYQAHPEHQKVVKFLKGINMDRACVDYEY